MRNNRGFSLIELLVVIAIIGLLTSVAMASFSQVQQRGRDARRIQDVQAISKAIALYDVNMGAFPISVAPTILNGTDAISLALVNAGTIPAVPRDPASPTYDYTYESNAAGNNYVITFCLVTDTIPGYNPGCLNTLTP